MGLDWKSQHAKLLSQQGKFMCGDITTHNSSGRMQPMVAMPVQKLPLWLASITSGIGRRSLRALPEPHPWPAAVLGDELDAGVFERGADGVNSALAQFLAAFEARDSVCGNLGYVS